ncbi:MAG: class I SAM-dependent methyltransferase [Polyangiaceae bacterium]|nr:class I SAM-dependent methyltransferase [Polyangiaceae bacterium]
MIPDSYFERFETPKYRTRNPVQRALIRRFVAQVHALFLEAGPVESVLEVGVGEGFLSGYLSEKLPEKRFTGVDVNEADLARLRAKFPRIATHAANIYDVGQVPGRFDLVICAEVLEHVSDPDRALRALVDLKPKQLLLTVPHEPWFLLSNLLRGKNLSRLGNDPEHVQLFTSHRFRSLLERHLTLERLTRSYPWLLSLGTPKG